MNRSATGLQPLRRSSGPPVSRIALGLAALLSLSAAAGVSSAANITVDTTADDITANGNCTLREAIQSANTDSAVDTCTAGSGLDTILLSGLTYTITLSGAGDDNLSGDFDIGADVDILGTGADLTIVDASALDRAFDFVGGNSSVQAMTITGGDPGAENGGGVRIQSASALLLGIRLTGNTAFSGGGLYVSGTGNATVRQCAIFTNSANGDRGGGILNDGTMQLASSTVYSNSAVWWGAGVSHGGITTAINGSTIVGNNGSGMSGIHSGGGGMTISNTIVAFNTPNDCSGTTLTDGGSNLIALSAGCSGITPNSILDVDPRLGAPGINGGVTETIDLLPGSPAFDVGGIGASCEPNDQVGNPHGYGAECDIGAFESSAFPDCSGGHFFAPNLGAFHMLGLPCDTGASDISALLGDDLSTAGYGTDWGFWRRDASLDVYAPLVLADTALPGDGFWFRTNVPPSGQGGAFSITGSTIFTNPLTTSLVDGVGGRWNLVGFPFEAAVSMPTLGVFYNATSHSLQQANTDGVASQVIYKWTGAAYQAFDPDVPGQEGVLRPWDAIWVKAFTTGFGAASLEIPRPGGLVVDRSRGPRKLGAGEWTVRLLVSGPQGSDAGNLLGSLAGSAKGRDAKDLPELPPMGSSFLTVVFPHDDWSTESGDYTTDFHPTGVFRDEWRFEVRSSKPEEPVTLTWNGPADVLCNSVLVDETTGYRYRANDSVYLTFTPHAASRGFRWVVDRPAPYGGEKPAAE